MEPSSLVFVAIIGVWAAYLVPHWLRRREQLAQSRTGDRHSAGLRVLARRRRSRRSGHRSGDPVLTSPRVVVDADGELLYIPAAPSRDAALPVESPAAKAARLPKGVEPRDLDLALAAARRAARRRAVIMALLLVAAVSGWGVTTVPTVPTWVAFPATALLLAHALASRAAGLRSRVALTVLAAQLQAAELARPRLVAASLPAVPVVAEAPPTPERVIRRQAAVGAETWEPVPVPPPTYTLKPAVHRPDPAPLDLPAASARGVSRGALPRTPADIERILALDVDDDGYDHRAVVNG